MGNLLRYGEQCVEDAGKRGVIDDSGQEEEFIDEALALCRVQRGLCVLIDSRREVKGVGLAEKKQPRKETLRDVAPVRFRHIDRRHVALSDSDAYGLVIGEARGVELIGPHSAPRNAA